LYFINVIIELTVIPHIFVVYLQILTNINVMEKIKSFKGKNLIVNEIKQFLIDKNSNVALINCEHIGSYGSKNICPDCGVRWNRLPKEQVFKELTLSYDATDTAWAELFSTNKSSVTRLRNRFNPKNNSEVWTESRFEKEINEGRYLDKKPIYDFFNLLEQYPRSSINELLKITELNQKYLDLAFNYYPEMKSDYKKIIDLRKSNNANYQYCYKCKIRKSNDKFIKFELNERYASICRLCADENLKTYNEQSHATFNDNYVEIETCKSPEGPHEFNRAKLTKDDDPLFCKKHQKYSQKFIQNQK